MKRLGIFFLLVFLSITGLAGCAETERDFSSLSGLSDGVVETLQIAAEAYGAAATDAPADEFSGDAPVQDSTETPAMPAKPDDKKPADKPGETSTPQSPSAQTPPVEESVPEVSNPVVPPAEAAPTAVVSIAIRGFEGSFSYNGEVAFFDGDTVAKVLTRYCDDKGIAYKLRGSGKNVYIVSIGGQKEFEHGALSGWQYSVNGVRASKGAGNYALKPGDSVLWEYLTEL